MKNLFYILLTAVVCFHNCEVYIAEENDKDKFEIDENIISISGIIPIKQRYTEGELFNTEGDRLVVRYLNNTTDIISSGFTQEWAEYWGYYDGSYGDWSADNSVWQPIKHGDSLSNLPSLFFVRAVYNGLKGSSRFRDVSPQRNFNDGVTRILP